jgi:tRNA modification GTPase
LQEISAKTHQGLESLKGKMVEAAFRGGATTSESGITITNTRHHSALGRTNLALNLALESLEAGNSGEFVAIDLRSALDALGEIVGITSTDDILDAIFSRFCIGK